MQLTNNGKNEETESLIKENIALKKEITILETANRQLYAEMTDYKNAYIRYNNNPVVKILKILTGKKDD